MTGLPTIQVLLDDGTGTFPTDVTSSTRLSGAITRTYGRQDEQADISPGQLSLVLDNSTGAFSPGGATPVTMDQKLRLKINGNTRLTGYVQSAPASWPTGGSEFSTITVTVVDAWSRFARMNLRSALKEEIYADNPQAFYPFTGDSQTTAEYDASGTGAPTLHILQGNGAIPVWGFDYGSADGSTGVQLTEYFGVAPIASSSYLYGVGGFGSWTSSSLHAEVVFAAPTTTVNVTLLALGFGGFTITLTTGGAINVLGNTVGSGLTDGKRHIVSVEATALSTFDVWIDGVKVGAGLTPTPNPSSYSTLTVQIGGDLAAITPCTFAVSHVNVGARISDARVQAHHLAAMTDCAGETPAARITRVCGYTGVAVGTLDANGDIICGPASQDGKALTDVFGEVSQATQGIVWVGATGAVTSVNGYTIAAAVTPVLTGDANWLDQNTVVENDLSQLVNDATGQASSSANVIPARNVTSIGEHGRYDASYTWNVSTDSQAYDLTWWKVNAYGEPHPRVPTLLIDLLSMYDSSLLSAAQTLDLGSFIRITGLPSQSPLGTSVNLIVQGITETIQASGDGAEWSLAVNATVRDLQAAWVLGDATYGVLGTTTKLYV